MNTNIFNVLAKKRKKSHEGKKGNNTMTKVLSAIIAIVLWMYVIGEVNPIIVSEIKNVEVKLVNVDKLNQSGLVVMGQDYYAVNVKVKGRRSDVINISSSEVNAIADMSGYNKGENRVPVDVNFSGNLDIETINPIQIKVTLDEVVKRPKPIQVEFSGSAAFGYIHGMPVLKQPEILVSGPETYVKSVDHAIATIQLNNTSKDVEQSASIRLVDVEGSEVLGVESDVSYVDISVPILRLRNVPIDVATVGNPAEGYEIVSVVQIPAKVDIMGREEVINNIDSLYAEEILLEGISETTEIPIRLTLPEGVQLVDSTKLLKIKVYVEQIISKELEYDSDDIIINDLKEGLKAEVINTSTVNLTAKGRSSIIEALSAKDIILSVSLKELGEGEHSVRVLWTSDKDIKTVQYRQEVVTVKITK